MYEIKTTYGAFVGTTEAPIYIKRAANGCFVQCAQKEAIGIAFQSEPYNLAGQVATINDRPSVTVTEVEAGKIIDEQNAIINKLLIKTLEG